jgi:hypothetical protein
MVEDIRSESYKKGKAVFSSSSDKQTENWKDTLPKELYAFIRVFIAAGQNRGKDNI